MNHFIKSISSFIQDEEGSQVVEYALIIAVISVALVGALNSSTGANSLQSSFDALLTKVSTCFSTSVC